MGWLAGGQLLVFTGHRYVARSLAKQLQRQLEVRRSTRRTGFARQLASWHRRLVSHAHTNTLRGFHELARKWSDFREFFQFDVLLDLRSSGRKRAQNVSAASGWLSGFYLAALPHVTRRHARRTCGLPGGRGTKGELLQNNEMVHTHTRHMSG